MHDFSHETWHASNRVLLDRNCTREKDLRPNRETRKQDHVLTLEVVLFFFPPIDVGDVGLPR